MQRRDQTVDTNRCAVLLVDKDSNMSRQNRSVLIDFEALCRDPTR